MTKDTISLFLGQGERDGKFLISDIATHGCSGGVPGITTYAETCAFYDKHKDEIWDMLYDFSEDQGFSIPFLMSDFSGAVRIYDEDSFKNFLVWWAVEVMAQQIEAVVPKIDYSKKLSANQG